MAYTVITHNGRMPCDGGRRLGFIAGGKVFAFPGVPLSGLVPPKPPAPAKPRGIVLADLRHCQSPANRCVYCESMWTRYVVKPLDGGGTKSLVQCDQCDTLMLDYFD